MTKKIILIITLCITFVLVNNFLADKKVESFCQSRDIKPLECHCIVDFFKNNTTPEVKAEFMDAIKKNQDFAGHPNLLFPLIGAGIKCKDVLEK